MAFLLQWFNDVFSTDISETCGKILNLLLEKHGCEVSPSPLLCAFLFMLLIHDIDEITASVSVLGQHKYSPLNLTVSVFH